MNQCPDVLICGFIRPQCLSKVVESVRKAKPQRVFIALDAPRADHPADVAKNQACKDLIQKQDWGCPVLYNFAEANMGCRKRMSSAISWAFKHTEHLIILEDDCVPANSFYRFCAEMFERYESDERIRGICGFIEHFSFQQKPLCTDSDYYFDRFFTCAGWATWKRAWCAHDPAMKNWPQLRDARVFKDISSSRREERCLEALAQDVYEGKVSSWATVYWLYSVATNGLFIHTTVNQFHNIGYGADSAHTADSSSPWAALPTPQIHFPLQHPISVVPLELTERFMMSNQYAISVWKRILWRIRGIVRRKS